MSSSSSASAGSGENRLDRRGEAEPVLMMPDDSPMLWLRPAASNVMIPGLESFPRGEVGNDLEEGADSRRVEGLLLWSSCRIPFRDVCGESVLEMW